MRLGAAILQASLATSQRDLLALHRSLDESRFTISEQAAIAKVIRERSEVLAEFWRDSAGKEIQA